MTDNKPLVTEDEKVLLTSIQKKKSVEKKKKRTGAKSDANSDIGKDIGRSPKISKVSKNDDSQGGDEENMLPSIESDPTLKKLSKKSKKVEEEKDNNSESKTESFLSISTPADDGQIPKVPSYSHQKNRGVIYISHVPHGFYEKQMREFFNQFGTVTNLRLGRSKRTGRSCGYAFVEFKYHEVAKVVSETMNNYLMFDKILKCSLVPKERVSPAIFKGKIQPNKPPGKAARVAAKKLHNSVKSEATVAKRQARQMQKVKSSLNKLKEAGIDYNFKIAEMSAA